MKLDVLKLIRQLRGIVKWMRKGKYQGTLEWATGVGKTFAAIIIIRRMRKKYPGSKVFIIVPKRALKAQWEDRLKKFGIGMENTKVMVINSLVLNNRIVVETDLLILDEIHRYASTEFSKVFKLVRYKVILGLTATIDRLDGKHTLLEKYAPVCDVITQKEAKEKGWIANFIEYNLGLELPVLEKAYYKDINKKYHSLFAYFGHDFNTAMKCGKTADAGAYATQMGFESKDVQLRSVLWNRAMKKRMDFLYGTKPTKGGYTDIKVNAAYDIIEKLQLKTITFSESTNFANRLSARVKDSVCYHSNLSSQVILNAKVIAIGEKIPIKKGGKKGTMTLYRDCQDSELCTWKEIKVQYPGCKKIGTDRVKTEALRMFEDNRYKNDTLITAKALDEGLDIEDIELGINCSYNSNPTKRTQRSGRIARIFIYKDGTKKRGIFINLYIKDTQDEVWLKKAQEEGSEDVRWITSIDEIKLE